ncbi:caspase domain-containing protein, partial [Streptomyces sp. NPDC017202]|uniref:caspase domain-containing protein n=1 Tax=Streptomyces sp. NPDC017202 TaxID=3364981 RepID=UPI0037ACF952
MTLPDPHASRAILIGVGQYAHLPAIPTVRQNIAALHEVLTGEESWNLPAQHCVTVHDPRTPEELVDPIYHGVQEATDTLLVYYAGHGLRGENRGELRLTRSTSRTGASHTSTDYNEIRETLLNSVAVRRIVILDCCYAAAALGTMSDPAQALAEEALVEGTYLIAAAGETQAAMADDGRGFTVFTGELVNLLRNGVSDKSKKFLDLDSIFSHLFHSLRSQARPLPHKRVRNSPGGLALSLNRQWIGKVPPPRSALPLQKNQPTLDSIVGVEAPGKTRPGAWPKAPADNVPTSGDKKATPTPAPPGAWP